MIYSKDITHEQYLLLCEELRKYCDSYYNKNVSLISDWEYDTKYRQLVEIEELHPDWVNDKSPTRFVGFKPNSTLTKVTHPEKLYSLDNVFNLSDLKKFLQCCNDVLQYEAEYCIEPKYDGLSLVAIYKKGQLVSIATRGDGIEGENVNHRKGDIKGLPLLLTKNVDLIVKGEVVMTFEDFERYNELADKPLSNPRNGAAGLLRRTGLLADKYLTFIPYDIIENEATYEAGVSDQSGMFYALLNLGFYSIVSFNAYMTETTDIDSSMFSLFSDIDDICIEIERADVYHSLFPFPCDGAVIKLNKFADRRKLGYTDRAPRHSIAYKFPPEEAETTLLGIDVQVGRTGVLTPVARIKPVNISNVIIENITLHNLNYIREKDIRVGDNVIVSRRGEVIPQIERIVMNDEHAKRDIWEMPTKCPSCGGDVVAHQAYYVCNNGTNCPDQKLGRFIHFCSKPAMNVVGVADSILKLLLGNKVVDSLCDLYKLRPADLNLPGFGDVKINNVLTSIDNSIHRPLHKFIYALGIEGVGEVTAKLLADTFKTFDNFVNATRNDLLVLKDIGETTADQILEYLQRNKGEINELVSLVQPKEIQNDRSGPLKGKTICFTGKSNNSRETLSNIVKDLGGDVSSSINKSVDFLILGEGAGSKLDKAKKLNITIKNEDWLLSLVGKQE